jgi:hypothetical protein
MPGLKERRWIGGAGTGAPSEVRTTGASAGAVMTDPSKPGMAAFLCLSAHFHESGKIDELAEILGDADLANTMFIAVTLITRTF